MSQNLWDHHRRLEDLELAIEALRDLVSAGPEKQTALRVAVQRLRANGAKGAAELLLGDRVAAPYRR